MKYTKFKVIVFFIYSLILVNPTYSQNPAKHIRKGNKLYDKKQYHESEISYRRAMENNNKWLNHALFNTGNALYKQQKYDEAIKFYEQLLAKKENLTSNQQAQIYHNLGNVYVMQQKYSEAAKSYKNSLRLNPNDEDTRYNLAWVLQKLQQQQQQQQENNKNQNQNNNNQQKNNEQDQNNNQDKEQKQQQQQLQKHQLSKDEMERILRALSQQDRNVQQQLKEKEIKINPYKPEKDW